MRSFFGVAFIISLLLLNACMTMPKDGEEMDGRQTVTAKGYVREPGTRVEIQGWSHQASAWVFNSVVNAAIHPTTNPFKPDDEMDWYYWAVDINLTPSLFYQDPDLNRLVLKIRAIHAHNEVPLATFDSDPSTANCMFTGLPLGGAAVINNCKSENSPEVKLLANLEDITILEQAQAGCGMEGQRPCGNVCNPGTKLAVRSTQSQSQSPNYHFSSGMPPLPGGICTAQCGGAGEVCCLEKEPYEFAKCNEGLYCISGFTCSNDSSAINLADGNCTWQSSQIECRFLDNNGGLEVRYSVAAECLGMNRNEFLTILNPEISGPGDLSSTAQAQCDLGSFSYDSERKPVAPTIPVPTP